MNAEDFTKTVRPTVIANKDFNKCFCVGFNKTGTTTLERVLRTYGYRMPSIEEQELRFTKNFNKTKYSEFVRFADQFDAFQDLPFSQELAFVVADALFPDSKFILTERDPESWFNSMVNFHKKRFYKVENISQISEKDVYEKFEYLYPGYMHEWKQRFLTDYSLKNPKAEWDRLYDKPYYIDQYERRNAQIKKYFSSTNKLLVIDVTKTPTTREILDFLNIPGCLEIKMPHANKT